jgi:hypothetical protein
VGRPEQVPADPPEAIDAHLHCHLKSSSGGLGSTQSYR